MKAAASMDGDYVLYILACDLKDRNSLDHDRVVATVMSNMGLELALRERGIDLARTAVGDKYVLEELVRSGGSLGGEQSGHIIFPKISLAGDGMITALELLRVVRSSGRTVSDLASGFTRLPQVLLNVRVGRKPALETIEPDRPRNSRGRSLARWPRPSSRQIFGHREPRTNHDRRRERRRNPEASLLSRRSHLT